jgi:NAD(P)-dependent dehydrogenase (short-subunit alcohol dehydrogenase family)
MTTDGDARVALVTGGGRGIGRAIAETLAAEGVHVAIAGRGEEALNDTVARIRGAGGTASAHQCDVAHEGDVERAFADVLSEHGRLDILVNNAAVEGPTRPLDAIATSDWDHVIAVNVRGAFLATRHAAVHMTARGSGHIVFLSALGGGLRAYPLRLPYAVSKAAVLAMMRTTAAELRPRGIHVNAVTPGPVTGERLDRVFARRAKQLDTTPAAVAQQLADRAPAGGFPDEAAVARLVALLCTPAFDHVVGQSLNVTGGIELA